jgi:hypothetical protein
LRTPRFRPLRAAVSLSALALVALLLAACGGGSSEDAKSTINDAFSHSIKSANVTLSVTAKIDGVAQLSQPVQVKLSGPFQSNGKTKLPSLNWQASFSGGGQSLTGGITSTGDNAYVSFQGSNYEVGQQQVAQINKQLSTQTGQKKTLKDFGIDPTSWVTDAQDKGTENVNGVDTTHVQAGVDVGKMLTDLNKTISQAGGVAGASAPQQLTAQQIDTIKNVVKNPKFDVYVGKDDKILRRLNVSIDFQIPEAQRSQFNGAQGGNFTFSLDFSDVGKPQTIAAPANPKPLSELQSQLGGLGGGGTSGGSGSSGSGSSGSGSSGSGSGSGGSGSSGSGGSSPNAQKFQKYSKCIEQADPGDTAAIQKCTAILK